MDNQQIIELFQSRGLIDQALAQDILAEVGHSGKEIAEILADFQVIQNRDDVWPVVASELGTSMVDLRDWTPPEALLALVPAGTARLHGALPVSFDETGLYVALVDPLNTQTHEDLRFALGREIHVVVAPDYLVEAKINDCYGGEGKAMEDILSQLDATAASVSAADLESEANSAPIIRYVDLVLYQAIQEKASDIHFEPFEKDFKIRYRVDGALYEMAPPPIHLAGPIISRVKVMSNMNIAERRVPQDGRIVKQFGEKHVDMRVSSLPTHHGESIVLRVLDRSSINLSLENLGLTDHIYNYITDTIEKPNGIFIVTGPTGAGKTTTLYAALRRINTIDAKLLTAEDPVEYDIDGIIQIPINEAIGLDFPRVLRAFLRQDPDRIMIGEMRDKETATIGIQAALTGHLVLSTLHTNDAPGAITRLVDMGIEPFLVASAIELVIAQRLVRRLCVECSRPAPVNKIKLRENLAILGADPAEAELIEMLKSPVGCDRCRGTGYRGRVGIFEIFRLNDEMHELVLKRESTRSLADCARKNGMRTLGQSGWEKIKLGYTSFDEVLRVVTMTDA